jgi:hypothetical protein
MVDLYSDNFIKFEEKKHQYFDSDGNEYQSMSRVLRTIQNHFDREGISKAVAKSRGVSQDKILAEWDKKRDDASDYGNFIHNGMEDYFNGKTVNDKRIEELAKSFSVETKDYYRMSTEHILYDKEYKIAGMTDLLLDRQKKPRSGEWIIDLMDYKTNLEKGIYFDSISRKNGTLKHYKKFLHSPLDHLEECNYNHYALQLSGYGRMLEKTYGVKIGKLFIVWIRYNSNSDKFEYVMIPVPYMKFEIDALFENYKNLKQIA